MGKIGWAMHNKRLAQAPPRQALQSMPHKTSFDHAVTQEFTKVPGFFSHHTDTKYGIDLNTFQSLDLRTLRQIVKQRVWNQQNRMKNVFLNQ